MTVTVVTERNGLIAMDGMLFERTGEVRQPSEGEWYWNEYLPGPVQSERDYLYARMAILRVVAEVRV